MESLGYVNIFSVYYQRGQYTVALQVLNPANIPLATAGGGGGPTVWVGIEHDRTIVGAVEKVTERYPKKLFWGHLEAVIVDPELAKNHMTSLLEFLDRTPRARIVAWLFVAQKPVKLSTLLPSQEPYPGQALDDFAEQVREKFGVYPIRVNEFLRRQPGYGREPCAAELKSTPAITPPGALDFSIGRIALFRGLQLVGWSSPKGTLGLLALRGAIHSERLILPEPGLSLRIIATSSQLRVLRQGYRPVALEARVSMQVALVGIEATGPSPYGKSYADWVTHQAEVAFSQMIRGGVKESQRVGSDYPGFGEAFREEDEKAWSGMASRWDTKIYPQLPLRVSVSATLVGLGQVIRGS